MRLKAIVLRSMLSCAMSGVAACGDSSSDSVVQLQSCAGIMPLGDSITLGANGGYRNDLYTGLQQNNCGVDSCKDASSSMTLF